MSEPKSTRPLSDIEARFIVLAEQRHASTMAESKRALEADFNAIAMACGVPDNSHCDLVRDEKTGRPMSFSYAPRA